MVKRKSVSLLFCHTVYICIHLFQNVFLLCPTPRIHYFLSLHWPSLRFLLFMAFFFPSIQFYFGLPRAKDLNMHRIFKRSLGIFDLRFMQLVPIIPGRQMLKLNSRDNLQYRNYLTQSTKFRLLSKDKTLDKGDKITRLSISFKTFVLSLQDTNLLLN